MVAHSDTSGTAAAGAVSELLEHARLLQHITDNTGRPILHVDGNHIIRFINRPFLQWIAAREEDIVGKHASQVLGEAAFAFYVPYFARAMAGETCSVETISYTRVPEARHIHVSLFPDRRTDGSITGVFILAHDVEEDFRLRQNLIAKEQEVRAIADNVGMPLSRSDHDLRYQYVNRVACEWFGRDEADIVGKTWAEVLGVEQFEEIRQYAERALAGETVCYERFACYPNHPAGHVRANIFPDRDAAGRVTGIFVVINDIEQDHRLTQEIVKRERQLRLITDNIGLPISYITADEKVGFYNRTGEEWTGVTEKSALGRPIEEAFGHDVVSLVKPFLKKAFSGEHASYERLATFKGRGRRWIRGHMVPEKRDDGSIAGVYTVLTDIHDDVIMREHLQEQERQLRLFTDNIPESIAYLDPERRYKFVNNTFLRQRGMQRHEVIGRTSAEVLGEDVARQSAIYVARALKGETVAHERLVRTADGKRRWFNIRTVPDIGEDGKVQGLYVVGMDIDELKRVELDLRRANWLLSSHFENTPLAVIEWDCDFRLRRWSPQAEKIFGWREEEVSGRHYSDWKFVVEGDSAQADSIAEKLTVHAEPRATSLHRNYRKDGRIIWCEWYNSSLRDEEGNIVSILSLAQDVTTRVLAEERLVHQATHDSLTGLPNRALLHDRLRQAISRARRGGYRIAAMFIDLDRFKDVNDTLGHRIGDELLREMASRLNQVVRESDLLVRLSGDEFMVVLEQVTDLEAPRVVATKLLDEIRLPSRVEGHDIHISGSIGISLFPDDADDVDTLLKNADMAMYRAKELGKNTYQVFSADLAEQGTAMRLLENALRSAVVRNEFELYYQPKVDMRSGRVMGAEALLRWHHPTRGTVTPPEFIHLAEETTLIQEIGNWVMDSAFAQLKRWHDAGFGGLRVAVNLAAGQFRATNLADNIRDRLMHQCCDPTCVDVEVTETGMLRDPEGVGRTLTALREMGLRVAIDDFGTGYSSLSHLRRFPIDTLKIDKTFVADILTDRDDAAIVSAVIAMARALNMEVIAEGVEVEAQRALLAQQGCDAYQGYFFSRPLPAHEFEALLQRHQKIPVQA